MSNLPGEIRDMLPPGRWSSTSYVPLSELPPTALDRAWALFHASLEPVYQSGKLGIVTFQFHLSFHPSESALAYVIECRRRLDGRFRMAAEFRCRRWFTEESWRQRASTALSAQGISWVAADELEHETAQRDRGQIGLPEGEVRKVLPIAREVTTPEFYYVRVHRRHGGEERKLSEEEVKAWAARIENLAAGGALTGPVYFLWGTEHRDVPLRNATDLKEALPENMMFEWKPKAPPGTIGAFFNSGANVRKGGAGGGSGAAEDSVADMLKEPEEDNKGAGNSSKVAASSNEKRGIKRYFSQS